jgi:ribonuclease HI
MEKINIFVPFNELIRNMEYKSHIVNMLKMEQTLDTLNVQDDHPNILFGPWVEEIGNDDDVPHFYVILNIHNVTLHNAMLDSGEYHNQMPKVIMEELGLDITRPYKDLFYFYSRKVKCEGLIKDIVVTLSHIPLKTMIMDVVVADITPKLGMLLSRSWATKLKGTLQMDMYYATMPVFGQDKRLYREVNFKYMVRNKDNPNNHPIYSIDIDIGSSIFYNDLCFEEDDQIVSKDHKKGSVSEQNNKEDEGFFNMDFDWEVNKERGRAGVWIISRDTTSKLFSYKLDFDCTNNIDEYEALILGLGVLKDLKDKKISVHGDSKLIINQIKDTYQTNYPRMRNYRNLVLDLLEYFFEYNISVVPCKQNWIAYALATSEIIFKIPIYLNKKYEIEVKHRPYIPDNVKHWKVFEDDK